MTPRGTASVALLVAAVTAFGAGVVPSVGEAARTTAALRAEAATGDIGAELRLRPASGPVRGLETGTLTVPDLGGGAHRVRVGVVAPRGEPIADLLFLHGHADRLDNHAALFADLAAAGVRVVSFDLPSHGETDAGAIDRWSTADLAALAARVVHATEHDPDRPFVLAGWSFGGLLATRFVQDPVQRAAFGRPIAALALESPAVVPLPLAGGDGVSRLRALTHDLRAPVAGPPQPASPFLDPVFAVRLVAQARVAVATPLPDGLPVLVEVGGDTEDRYVDVPAVRSWAGDVAPRDGADVRLERFPDARHGIDLEAWPVGDAARTALVDFVRQQVSR
ncbi:alpha/beta fold hydrolase [Curtobacterium sp. C1]|uniref:alpha/beta hydrolase n=1 Tax=Curtobacterium sp. C1 TaxID=2898151 RepID=UPI001E54D5A2|nr:alpha/beta fold hydrolase [Curtobacterium sp. C1]UFU14044.1 alpha/beta fold hydrolase [Curtobacterium sp. C1]